MPRYRWENPAYKVCLLFMRFPSLPFVLHGMKVLRSFFSTHLMQRSIALISSSPMPLSATGVKLVHTDVKCMRQPPATQ